MTALRWRDGGRISRMHVERAQVRRAQNRQVGNVSISRQARAMPTNKRELGVGKQSRSEESPSISVERTCQTFLAFD